MRRASKGNLSLPCSRRRLSSRNISVLFSFVNRIGWTFGLRSRSHSLGPSPMPPWSMRKLPTAYVESGDVPCRVDFVLHLRIHGLLQEGHGELARYFASEDVIELLLEGDLILAATDVLDLTLQQGALAPVDRHFLESVVRVAP